jgi:hypothetical protein
MKKRLRWRSRTRTSFVEGVGVNLFAIMSIEQQEGGGTYLPYACEMNMSNSASDTLGTLIGLASLPSVSPLKPVCGIANMSENILEARARVLESSL